MAKPIIPTKAKLFTGIIFSSDELLIKVKNLLMKKFGIIDLESPRIPFSHTEYYNNMGSSLFKIFFAFKKLITHETIVPIKLYTNKLEKKYAVNSNNRFTRKVNIDPGYLTLSNVYLASCKEYFHRTYLTKGVYLENEYWYTAKQFQTWDWTYPDYKKIDYLNFFHELRKIYYKQINRK